MHWRKEGRSLVDEKLGPAKDELDEMRGWTRMVGDRRLLCGVGVLRGGLGSGRRMQWFEIDFVRLMCRWNLLMRWHPQNSVVAGPSWIWSGPESWCNATRCSSFGMIVLPTEFKSANDQRISVCQWLTEYGLLFNMHTGNNSQNTI